MHLSRSSDVFILHQGHDDDEYDDLVLVQLDDERDQYDIYHDPLMRFTPGIDFRDVVLSVLG